MNDHKKINVVQTVIIIGALAVAGAFLNAVFQQELKISAKEADIIKLKKENSSLKEELDSIYGNPEGFIYNYNTEKAQQAIENGSAEVPSPVDR